jgi:uncharacterized SAM-binding protein YcdF (DUF218 family)
MTDLPAKSPSPTSASSTCREVRRTRASTGALLGTLLWLECVALGVPKLLFLTRDYDLIPFAALAGALLGLTRLRRVLLATAAGLAVVLVVIAHTPAIRRPTRALIRSDPVGARKVQAIVVLSGGITTDGHLEPHVADRMLTGLSLIRRGVASTLVVSRERRSTAGHAVTSDADQQRLVALLERPVRLLIVDSVSSTRDEAVRMRALARSLDITSVAVVTSPTHTYRACATFEKVGFAVTCVPSESREVPLETLRDTNDRVLAFQRWLYEWVALAKYRASGWI